MSTTTIGEVALEVSDDPQMLRGTPLRREQEEDGLVQYGALSTSDGLRGTVGVIAWTSGPVEVRFLDFLDGPAPYRRLERAGQMTLTTTGGRWTTLLRALKHGGREWPTLADVSWDELDALAGEDARHLLEREANAETGTWLELNPSAVRYRDTPAVRCDENDARTILNAYALTRVLPIMKNFGLRVPEVFL